MTRFSLSQAGTSLEDMDSSGNVDSNYHPSRTDVDSSGFFPTKPEEGRVSPSQPTMKGQTGKGQHRDTVQQDSLQPLINIAEVQGKLGKIHVGGRRPRKTTSNQSRFSCHFRRWLAEKSQTVVGGLAGG